MRDQKQWTLGTIQLQSLRANVPSSLTVARVDEYHAILNLLESSSGENLSMFRIPASEMKPRALSFRIGSQRHAGSTQWSTEKYADKGVFERQLDALSRYIQTLQSQRSAPQTGSRDYWSMNDVELEALATEFNIQGYGDAHGIDRDTIISTLLKRDKARNPPLPNQTIHVETMTGSVIQQGTSHSHASVTYQSVEVRQVVERIKEVMGTLPLSGSAKEELAADIQTIEPQLASPHPKGLIIRECLHSMRAVLEGAAGSLIASGIVNQITQVLGK